MQTGAITSHLDVAQLTLYAFWLFFAGVLYYLHRENKREGYPLISDRSAHISVEGFPPVPEPKVFRLASGHEVLAPRHEPPEEVRGVPTGAWPGAPLVPLGNGMQDAIGPAAFAARADEPDTCFDDGRPKIVPLRAAPDFFLATEDPDLIGWTVLGADGTAAGCVVEAWIDRSEVILRYIEVALAAPLAPRTVLLPMPFAALSAKTREVRVSAILAEHFADVPALRNADSVTLREEDRICAYYAGGMLYATPARAEPLL